MYNDFEGVVKEKKRKERIYFLFHGTKQQQQQQGDKGICCYIYVFVLQIRRLVFYCIVYYLNNSNKNNYSRND